MMPIRSRWVHEDITAERQVVITASESEAELGHDRAALLALMQENLRLNSFDVRVADAERWAHGHRSASEAPEGTIAYSAPALGSRPWYADHILQLISSVRDAQARGEHDLAVAEAVEAGAIITEAQAKFGPWREQLLDQARLKKNRELSARGAAVMRAKAAERDADISREADAYRRSRPDPREYSTRSMAHTIAHRLDMKVGTVRDRLRRLGRR
jgi:hypothetical protein